MRRALPILAILLSGCVERVYASGVMRCPEFTFDMGDLCVVPASAFGWGVSLVFTLWLINTISATRAAVDRVEKKLTEKKPAPPDDASRS